MMESWPNPLTSPDKATPTNIQPGSVIFFETSSGSPGVNHVAIVYSVSDDSVVYVQSNSPAKRGSLTFNDNGVGVQSLPGIQVVNFGAP
jgi:cell wall-associated NlpC family hydrolase